MDQLKEFLRQAIRYRFWIAVGISAILPMIAYMVGSGPIKSKAAAETATINEAQKGVQQYSNGTIPNDQYKPLVDKEKEVLSKDVNASWKKLYARQAPLLTWPAIVEERFHTWGNKYPENIDASAVQGAIIDYVDAYAKQVTDVYKTFNPFDPVEGTGAVAAPPESVLLKPAPFTTQDTKMPPLGKVWAAQERLWVQRTLLSVIADVNKGTDTWDNARIKQVNTVDVGTMAAQDQVSIAGGQALEQAPALDPPGTAAPAAPAAGDAGAPAGMAMPSAQDADLVYYIKAESPQCKILPFQVSVLINQDNVQDLLVALENSPMSIQVAEVSWAKPATKVVKPQKGTSMNEIGSMNYNLNMSSGMTFFGGGMNTASANYRGQRGTDVRSKDRAGSIKEQLDRAKKQGGFTFNDPYYNIIELTIYGQARFYNAPPPDAPVEPSQAAAPAGDAPKADGEAPKAEPAKEGEAPKGEPAKTEPAKAEGEAPKGEPAKTAPAKEGEAPKGEPAKTEEQPKAKAEAPAEKAEPAKAEGGTPKADDASKKDEAPAEKAEPKSR